MAEEKVKGRVGPAVITIVGISLWLAAAISFFLQYGGREQLVILALMPLAVITGMFPNSLPLPAGLKLSQEKLTFTLSDALVLLIACRYGFAACVFVAGIEGYTSSWRAVRRLSSNLFSFGMMSLAAAAASLSLSAVLRYGFGETLGNPNHAFPAIAVAVLAASMIHIIANTGLISVLFAMRLGKPVLPSWKENFLLVAPMILPTSAAASLMYIALQYNALIMIAIGAPILIAIHCGHRSYRDSVQEQINLIERAQQERIALTEKAHRETIEALAVTINAKDEVTHGHILRVQIYAAGVARLLGCTEVEVEALRAGALLHDIGKIAVPDYILNKPGKLTAEEFEKMKMHTLVGAQILGRVDFPYPVVPVVRHHHERWDGRGYPDGLKAEEIPLTARILSVVDCFDAVREDRQYRKAMTREEAIDFIMRGSGQMYDPRVVGTFITHLPEFEAEILAHRGAPQPTFGIEPVEQLSHAARDVAPAAGLAEAVINQKDQPEFSHGELRSLYELAQSLNGARHQDEVVQVFLDKLKTIVPYDACAVALGEPETGGYRVKHAAGQHASLLKNRQIAVGEGVTGWALANRQPFANTDPKLDLPPALATHFASYRTLAIFPIIKELELLGAVSLYSASLAEYTSQHQHLLTEALALLAASLLTKSDVESASVLEPPSQFHGTAYQSPPVSSSALMEVSEVELKSEMSH